MSQSDHSHTIKVVRVEAAEGGKRGEWFASRDESEAGGWGSSPALAVLDLLQQLGELPKDVPSMEQTVILHALERTGGIRARAAALCGISLRKMHYMIHRLQQLGWRVPPAPTRPKPMTTRQSAASHGERVAA